MIKIKAINKASNAIVSIIDKEVDEAIRNNRKMLFVVPETAKASIERILFDKVLTTNQIANEVGSTCVTSGLIDFDVISFIKLSERIVTSCGSELEGKSDDLLLRNVIYRIFVLHYDEFKTINKYVKRFEYIDMLIRLLGDFSRYGVNEDCLDEVLNSATVEDGFYDKIHDLKLLISYINKANEEFGYSLMDNYLNKATNVVSKICSNRSLLDRRIYSGVKSLVDTDIVIYGFGSVRSLTPQERNLVESLSDLGSNVIIYPLFDMNNDANELFYFGKQLVDSFSKNGKIDSISSFEFDSDKEVNNLKTISKAYSLGEVIKTNESDDSVRFIRMNNRDDMLSYVCNEIIRLTREENYRYKDIRVFCPDEAVTERFKGIMRLFKLDAFIDRKIVLNSTPIMRYVEIMLELSLHRYPIEDVLRLLRTGLVPVTSEVVDYFENYCKAFNITFENRIFDESRYVSFGSEEEKKEYFTIFVAGKKEIDGGKYLWDKIISGILLPLKEVIDRIDAAKTIAQKSVVLMEHLDTLRPYIESVRDEFIDRKDSDTASAIVRGYKEIMSLLSSFASPSNDIEIDLEQFASLIKIDIRNKVVGTIPLTVDSIEIVNEASACFTPCKVMFMVGCNASNFPHKSSSDGIMSNNELIRLNSEISVDLPDKAMTQSKEEFVRSALIVNLVSDRVYMFTLDNEFESSVMSFFREAMGVESASSVLFKTPIYGLPVDKRHLFEEAKINPELIRELFNSHGNVSVSSLEKFNKCALSYMLDNMLKIRVRKDETSVKLNLVGTLVHDMFENSIKDIANDSNSIEKLQEYVESLDESKLSSLADKYFSIARLNCDSPDKNSAEFEMMPGIKVKRIFKRALPTLLKYCVDEKYMPTYFEHKVENLDVPFKVTTDNNLEFLFRGSVDRVDISEEDGSLRIVDYKTGSKSIDMRKFIAGVQIQLFSYALALDSQNEETVIDNVGYIEAVLSPTSRKDSKGQFLYEASELNKDEMKVAINHASYLIKKSCNEISNGKADARINSKVTDSCDYCDYKGLCGNNPGNKTKKVVTTDLPPEEIDKSVHKSGSKFLMSYYIDVMKRNEENG